jgi:branched-chain amino acid aminotransferase
MLPTTAKACAGYLNSMLAARESRARGYDEALLLDRDGNIAEGRTENIFIVLNGRLITNDEQSSILMGITRDAVIQIARDLGYDVEIKAIRMQDLLAASEAFFTGTAAEVTAIREVDGTAIGGGGLGPVTERIQQEVFAATSGKRQKYGHWLSLVEPTAVSIPQQAGAVP